MHDENNKPDQLDAEASSILSSHQGRKARHKFKITMLVAIFCAALMITCVTVKPVQDAEAIVPLVAILIFAAGAATYMVLDDYINGKNIDKGSGDGLTPSNYMELLKNDRVDLLTARSDQLVQVKEDLVLAKSLYTQRANLLAYNYWRVQETAGQPHIWNYSKALFGANSWSAIGSDMSAIMRNASAMMDSIWIASEDMGVDTGFSDLSQSFTGSYASCKWGLVKDSAKTFYLGWNTYQYPKAGLALTKNVNYYLDSDVHLYAYGAVDSTVIIKNLTGVTKWTVTLPASEYGQYNKFKEISLGDLSGWQDGIYSISGTHTQAAVDYMLPTNIATTDSQVKPAILWMSGNASANHFSALCIAGYSGANCLYAATDYEWTTSNEPNLKVSFWDGGAAHYFDLFTYLTKLSELYASMKALLVDVSNSAQSYFNWCAANNPTSPPPDPTAMFLDPSQMSGLTQEQIMLLYRAYLDQMKDWFNSNTNYLPDNVTINPESLDLKIRGSIYNESGVLKYSNLTIWTPWVTTADMTVSVGRTNFTQTGRLVVWGYAPSIEAMVDVNRTKMDWFYNGWYANVEEIVYKGQQVSSVDLTRTSMALHFTTTNNSHFGGENKTSDWEWIVQHWYYVAIVFGIIMVVAALATRNGVVALIGLVCLVAGAAGYFLQDFSLSNELGKLFKFEISQLHSMIGRWK